LFTTHEGTNINVEICGTKITRRLYKAAEAATASDRKQREGELCVSGVRIIRNWSALIQQFH